MSQSSKGPVSPAPASGGKVVDIGGARPVQDPALKNLPATAAQGQVLAKPQPAAPAPLEPRPRHAPPLPKRRKRRSFGMWLSMFFFITVPTAVAAVYFLAYAADQYVTTAQFTIRTQTMGKFSMDNIGGGLGAISPASPAFTDSQIVQTYIHSGQLLKDIRDEVDLHAVYSHPSADWWTAIDPAVSDEGLLEYWQKVSSVHYDLLTGITTFTVRAYSPEDAEKVGSAVLKASEELVNELSKRARGDVVKLAQDEADRSRERLDTAIAAIEASQDKQRQVDPTAESVKALEIRAKLEGEISIRQAELSALQEQLSDNAPSVRLLKGRIVSMKAELESLKAQEFTPTGDEDSAGKRMADSTKLKFEQEIAAKLYAQALATLEGARQDAAMQSRYLVAFVKPKLPDASLYPERFYSIAVAFVVACLVWLFTMLIGAVVREHA